jgi:hypothetical protein
MKKFVDWVDQKNEASGSAAMGELDRVGNAIRDARQPTNASNYNIQSRLAGVRNDRSVYGQAAWEGLQTVYDALKKIGESDPKRLSGIVQKIKSEIQKTDPSLARDMVSGMNRFVSKAMGLQKQGENQ